MNNLKEAGKQKYGIYVPETKTFMYVETTSDEFKKLLDEFKRREISKKGEVEVEG